MTPAKQKTKRPWNVKLARGLRRAARVILIISAVLGLVIWSGLADRWARRAIVARLEQMTGGRVELRSFHFEPLALRAELGGLTIHGREPVHTPPFFHADSLRLDIRVDSFFRRKISLNEVDVDRPEVHIRVESDGSSNVPIPKSAALIGGAWQERMFELAIRRLRVTGGEFRFNDVRVPVAGEGGEFRFALDSHAGAPPAKPFYTGELSWQHMQLALRRYIPFASDVTAKFTLEPGALTVNQIRWKLPHSELEAEAAPTSFVQPSWKFRYRSKLALEDIRAILRKPNSPGGMVDFSGEGTYASGHLHYSGGYSAHEIAMSYPWFRSRGMSGRGSYRGDARTIEFPDFEAQALGGTVQGRVNVQLNSLGFRAETHAHGMSLAAVLEAVNRPDFPVAALHWNAAVDVNSVTTWTADFKDVDSRGLSLWGPPGELRGGEIPATARLDYHYSMDHSTLELQKSAISTPTSHIEMSGVLGIRGSVLAATFDTQDLLPWDDFIQRIRGAGAEPARIAGRAHWQGRVEGPLAGPTFSGHVKGTQISYNLLSWDEAEGDMSYSPDEFRLLRGRARRGRSSAAVEGSLELDHWSFSPGNQWSLEASFDHAPTDDLQALLGWSYPARGLLSGTFHGRGTRGEPELTGLLDLVEVEAWGYRLDRARGQLALRNNEIRINNAELRTFATPQTPSGARTGPPGVLTGNFLYRFREQEIAFDLTGAVIPLEGIAGIQSARLPLGGQLSFQLRGQGSLLAPVCEGTLRLVDLRVGKEVLGSFDGRLSSDGRRVHFDVNSAMSAGKLQGKIDLTLANDYPFEGDLALEGMDLDPFIQTALHLTALTGHSNVNGRFIIRGALRRPGSLSVEADISRLVFDYENVKLENVGPLRIGFHGDEVRIEQAKLRGPESDFSITGFARFGGDRRVSLSVAGAVNLRLAGGFLPGLEARGPAQVNASIEGTFANPRITGKVRVENAAANYGDFPAGLSQVTGDFVFDASRLLFENVSAETGGGKLLLSGTLTYGDGPLRYDITAATTRVRIRYPEGMSWLIGGTLRLSGTRQAGLLSGRVTVERLMMAQGFDLATLIIASKEPVRAPTTTSPYLRNLQFDIEAVSSPGARVEWTGARVESEASLRVRGTWEHPILLGHIHLLTGEMTFRGNRYRLSRGDINFANPFRLDPVLNVEATTTIRQYEITLNFTGPASRLTLAYRSDPPMPASDVIALLALGRTGEESELRGTLPGQTSEMGANALLSEAISSQLGGRLERLFGISRFRVDPFLAGTGTEPNAAARITIEQQVTRDLVITYITNVTSTQQQVIQVEYSVSRDVSIIGLRDQNGTFGLDVKFKKRFK